MPGLQNSKRTLDYLGTIGSQDKGDNVTMSATAQALVELSFVLIDTARKNLTKGGHDASGDLSQSMVSRDIVTNGTKLELDVELNHYYKFLDKGVKGTERGKGKYSFKSKYPSKKMALSILKWFKQGRAKSLRIRKPLGGKQEEKNLRLKKSVNSSDNLKSLAYAVATNIKKNGIDPTKFWTDALTHTRKEQKKIFADALRIDIIESLKNN